ncbi:9309_t:CDS:2 [Scutellospora calospora]|uniref:9309_t:CDS:1 n=1 Tax=Scutellospora calospora TaxID=85575 RepID=A0ACA9K6U1_9GLOM|nr:9309_t:CDS:2 [Scutellospora calospora]
MSSILKPFHKGILFSTYPFCKIVCFSDRLHELQYLKPKLKNLPENAEQILQDEYTARIVLRAMKECPFPDDPVLIIKWDDRGFNDVPTVPGCRNGVPGQTKAAIITHLVTNGAVDVYGLNLIFMFRNSDALGQWPGINQAFWTSAVPHVESIG